MLKHGYATVATAYVCVKLILMPKCNPVDNSSDCGL